jgi:hypothetical protein
VTTPATKISIALAGVSSAAAPAAIDRRSSGIASTAM